MSRQEAKYPDTVSPLKDIEDAKYLYLYNDTFQVFVAKLSQEFSNWRSMRGDGNCYYRAVGVSLLEKLVKKGKESLLDFKAQIDAQSGYYRPHSFIVVRRDLLIYYLDMLVGTYDALPFPDALERTLEYTLQQTDFDLELIKLVRTALANFLDDNYDSEEIQPFTFMPKEEVLVQVISLGQEAENLVFMGAPTVFNCQINHIMQATDGSLCTSSYSPKGEPRFELNLWLRFGHYELLYKPSDRSFVPGSAWLEPGPMPPIEQARLLQYEQANGPNILREAQVDISLAMLRTESGEDQRIPKLLCVYCKQRKVPDNDAMKTLGCEHAYCAGCLGEYIIKSYIEQNTAPGDLNCVVEGCGYQLDSLIVEDLIDNLEGINCPRCYYDKPKKVGRFIKCSRCLIEL
eukprot:CAMPEP_0204897688 /NCGR_PEP_ID=MMETSP1397-20131031/876_1 /ASSEMBLY_ACC=CAM_ASM_000891 /TAXON_ID=49980 /ORGANISM="Climacostomum Climacostomum virens, Strain Stock W-24" /LENGTH=401 /DNA_ID=CAMNT_0052065465 /DNA_START=1158 /DNA_END=2359 /DNA_ORIENTATION=-